MYVFFYKLTVNLLSNLDKIISLFSMFIYVSGFSGYVIDYDRTNNTKKYPNMRYCSAIIHFPIPEIFFHMDQSIRKT